MDRDPDARRPVRRALARACPALVALLGAALPARAQCESARLVAPDAADGARFGRAVSASGARTLVGAAGRAAYLFEDDALPPVVLLPPPGTPSGDAFGAAVALDGDVAVVGAPADDGVAPGAGAAHVFERRAGTWTLVGTLRPRGAHPGAEGFGAALALDGDTLLVGRPGDDSGGDDRGAVDVFERASDGWRQTGKLTEDGGTTPYFGTSVALRGDRALVGSPGAGLGAAFVFERDVEGWWGQVGRLESPQVPAPDVDYGRAVALLGELAVVSAPRWTWDARAAVEEGALFVFASVDDAWTQVDALRAPDVVAGAPPRALGTALAAHGDALAAGAPDGARGQVQLFERAGPGTPLVPTARLLGDVDDGARLGAALALADARLVAGAPDAAGGGARVFAASWGRPFVTGLGLASPDDAPCLCAHVDVAALHVTLAGAPGATGWLALGVRVAWTPFAGGVLVPSPEVLLPVVLDPAGRLELSARPASLDGAALLVQAAFLASDAPVAVASNALVLGAR